MELSMERQAAEAAATLLAGLGLGCLYTVLGTVRRRSGRVAAAALDVFFCAVFAAAVFLLGMGPGRGTLRLYMAPLALLGAALWDALFGAVTRRWTEKTLLFFRRGLALLKKPLEWVGKKVKKIKEFLKNIFSTAKKRFTIINNHATIMRRRLRSGRRRSKETADEAQAIQYIYEDRDPGAAGLRGHYAGGREKPDHRGKG